jgi:hypothetical protein
MLEAMCFSSKIEVGLAPNVQKALEDFLNQTRNEKGPLDMKSFVQLCEYDVFRMQGCFRMSCGLC